MKSNKVFLSQIPSLAFLQYLSVSLVLTNDLLDEATRSVRIVEFHKVILKKMSSVESKSTIIQGITSIFVIVLMSCDAFSQSGEKINSL